MSLKPETERALHGWLGPFTWDSNHQADLHRFYQFIHQYQREHGFDMDEHEMQQIIREVAISRNHPFGEFQEEIAQERVSLAVEILDYLRVTQGR